tara:strand:+ start:1148 stop:1342 length:195 start_codon:yes stop_codon:yes gene_type:complete
MDLLFIIMLVVVGFLIGQMIMGRDCVGGFSKEMQARLMGNKNARMRFGVPSKVPPNNYAVMNRL